MDPLRRQVRRAQWWLGVQRFVNVVGWSTFVGLLTALALIAYDKYRPLGVEPFACGGCLFALGVLAAVAWAFFRSRGPMEAALEIDRRFGLKERISSALALSPEERESPLGQALVQDSLAHAGRIHLRQKFTIHPGRQLLLPLVPGLAAILVSIFIESEMAEKPAEANAAKVVKKQVQVAGETLRKKVEEKRKEADKEGLQEAKDALGKLERDIDNLVKQPTDHRDAMVKLNELTREMEKRKLSLGSPEAVRQQLNQMKDLKKGPADRFADQVAKGNLDKAVEELQKLRNDLDNGKLSQEQTKALADQLEQMEKKLNQQVEEQKKKEEQLQKRIDQARQEGKDGEADKLEQQLQQLRNQGPQGQDLQRLAQKLGNCAQCLRQGQGQKQGQGQGRQQGQAAGQQLQDLQNDLQDLKRRLNEAEMLDGAIDQLAQARQQMGCQKCGGAGCEACQGGGEGNKQGKPGMGLGKGRGAGARPERADDTHFRDTQAAVKLDKGELVVVGQADGPNIRGDTVRQIEQQVEAARREEADPLTNQKIPHKQQEQVGQYFDDFRTGTK